MDITVNGGSAWESNPAPPRWRGATDFEDREGHRAPFASGPYIIAEVLRTDRSSIVRIPESSGFLRLADWGEERGICGRLDRSRPVGSAI